MLNMEMKYFFLIFVSVESRVNRTLWLEEELRASLRENYDPTVRPIDMAEAMYERGNQITCSKSRTFHRESRANFAFTTEISHPFFSLNNI